MMDFVLLYTLYKWAIYGKSWRLPIAMTALYGLRYFFYVSFSLPITGYSWCTMNSSLKGTFGSSQAFTPFQFPMACKTTSSSAVMWVWLWSVDANSSQAATIRWPCSVSWPWSVKACFSYSWEGTILLMLLLLYSLDTTSGSKLKESPR